MSSVDVRRPGTAARNGGNPPERPQLVRELDGFAGEGFLYSAGGQHFLVYTSAEMRSWDVAPTPPDRITFNPTIISGAPSRDEAVARLASVVTGPVT